MGVACGLLFFFIFLMILSMTHDYQAAIPTDLAGLKALHEDQCEHPIHGWVVEVQNTLSNAGYAIAGALILFRVQTWAGLLYGINLLLLSVASGLYHATLDNDLPRTLDVGWVYAVLLSLSAFAAYVHVQAEKPLNVPWWVWVVSTVGWVVLLVATIGSSHGLIALLCMTVFVVVLTALCYLAANVLAELKYVVIPALFLGIPLFGVLMRDKGHFNSTDVFIILIGLLLIQFLFVFTTARSASFPLRWRLLGWELALLVGFLIPGFAFRLLDGYDGDPPNVKEKLLCVPTSAFQPHAHWHLLGAVALLLSYDLLVQFQQANLGRKWDQTVLLPDEAATGPEK
jgi:hypothetical protein